MQESLWKVKQIPIVACITKVQQKISGCFRSVAGAQAPYPKAVYQYKYG